MDTPIVDYVKKYIDSDNVRAHMPGHKGAAYLGFEGYDITEIKGADSLYFADGIIAESEENAGRLFGSAGTYYSTEGSSQCIKAMLFLALSDYENREGRRPYIVAARNVHTSFIHAAALLDLDVKWIFPDVKDMNICSCLFDKKTLSDILDNAAYPPVGVYVTSPDYLGNVMDIEGLAEICHEHGTKLLVDNAHGAYLRFLDKSLYPDYSHPLEKGADICCDSAHKTLPVLTGGAYLHISERCSALKDKAKYALSLFGSTSPSYLILQSLDLCNAYIDGDYRTTLKEFCHEMDELKERLKEKGWRLIKSDPMKLTLEAPDGLTGSLLLDKLEERAVSCEYADDEYLVMMLSCSNSKEDINKVEEALDKCVSGKINYSEDPDSISDYEDAYPAIAAMSVREAVFGNHQRIKAEDAVGRICAASLVACPPAIPIAVPGEIISPAFIKLFKRYNISHVDVIS